MTINKYWYALINNTLSVLENKIFYSMHAY